VAVDLSVMECKDNICENACALVENIESVLFFVAFSSLLFLCVPL